MKLLGVGVLVVFLGYWMVQAPDSLAAFTKNGGSWVWDTASTLFSGVINFLGTLFHH